MHKVVFVLLALGLVSGTASAIPVQWTLTGVTFSDGGTASGSFVYDTSTNTYGAVNITTTAGTVVLSGATLRYVAVAGLTPTIQQLLVTDSNGGDLTGARAFALFFTGALAPKGGSRVVTGQEASCANAACTGPSGASRTVSAGLVTGLPLADPVPALSPWALLAAGLLLAAVGFVALRKSLF